MSKINKQPNNDFISWATVSNIVPIITSFIVIALSWASLTTRLSLIEQKLDFISITLEKHYKQAEIKDIEIKELQEQVAIVKNILKF
jgi:hypothetical protein